MKYRITQARYTRDGAEHTLPYGTGFLVSDIEQFRHKFMQESHTTHVRFTYEEIPE